MAADRPAGPEPRMSMRVEWVRRGHDKAYSKPAGLPSVAFRRSAKLLNLGSYLRYASFGGV